MRTQIIKTTFWSLVGVATLAQFVRPDRSNPAVTREVMWDSEATRDLVRGACYDCHSNETGWPWYSSVAPVSWLVANDVSEGREHLNFSTWDQPNHGIEEIVEMVESGEMPLWEYALMHPRARLDEQQRTMLLQGLRATLTGDPPVPDDEDEGHEHD